MNILDKFNDLGARSISAVVLIAIAVICVFMGPFWITSLIAAAAGVMMWEYARLTKFNPSRFMLTMIVAAVAAIFVAYLSTWWAGLLVLIIGGLALYRPERREWALSVIGYAYIGGAALAIHSIASGPNSILNLFWVILVVVLSDVGGYFAGRQFGGPKLWPAISPKKTWSGTLGGWVLATIAGIIIAILTNYALFYSILVCMILTIAAQAGDLLESWVKRRQGVKDASNLIPGHGGFLDRFDGLLAASLAFVAIPGIW